VKKRKLILHIGLHKTGTSAIQSFLGLNRNKLFNEGIYVPRSNFYKLGEWDIHHFIADVFKKDKFNQSNLKTILSKIVNDSKKCHTVLISSEMFYEPCIDLKKIKTYFSEYFSPIIIIIYLRRQDYFSCSIYNQMVKGAGITDKLDPLRPKYYNYNYFNLLQSIGEIFGRDNIIIGIYEKEQFIGENIFNDFIVRALGLKINDNYTLPSKNVNISLNLSALEFCRISNIIKPRNNWSEISDILVDYSSKFKDLVYPGITLFTKEQQFNLVKKYELSNNKVAYEFLKRKEEPLFKEPVSKSDIKWKQFPGLSFENALDIVKFVYNANYKVFTNLYNSLSTLNNMQRNNSVINYINAFSEFSKISNT
jgi:hypothetical protein